MIRTASTWLLGLALAAAACAQAPAKDAFRTQAEQLSVGPAAPPVANATSFAPALRCMDGLFRSYGAKDVSVLIEDIPDATSKVKVGAKDMFLSATSQMTRGSRAVRLIPWGGDGAALYKNRDDVLKSASFAVQGSISQFDETMLRKQRDGAICLGPLCIGGAESDSFSGMSLDLNMIETEGLTLLPGVTSKNYVLVRRKGRGGDGDLSMKKFGIQYNFTFNSSDGQGQALRTLVELSVIELYGRLLKIPYWSCLGLTPADAGVALEIEDWWETLRGDTASLASYLQIQMKARGLYAGAVNGEIDEDLKRAVRAYKGALGQAEDLNVNLDFLRAYFAADHAKLQGAAVQRLAAITAREGPVAPPPPAPVAEAPLLQLEGAAPARGWDAGQAVEFSARLGRDAFLYCYLIDERQQVTQFFPNPARPAAAVAGGERIVFPGGFGFRIKAGARGTSQAIACLAAARDLGREALPRPVAARDAESLRAAIAARVGQAPEMGVIDVTVK